MAATPDDSRPVPDPTSLTRDAVDALEAQLTRLFSEQLRRLEDIMALSFKSVDEKLDAIERWRMEQKQDTSKAVDAALAAAKEAVGQQSQAFAVATEKTERAFTEQLRGQRDTFGTAIAAMDTRYADLKETLNKVEYTKLGGQEYKGAIYAALGVVIALLVLGLGVAGFAAGR